MTRDAAFAKCHELNLQLSDEEKANRWEWYPVEPKHPGDNNQWEPYKIQRLKSLFPDADELTLI
jgi:hypothetical protein